MDLATARFAGSHRRYSTDSVEKLASKISPKNFGREKAIAAEFCLCNSFSTTLVVKHFLKIGDFLCAELRE
ncbi:MAG: hypothetical protein KGK05_02135 [Xanthomonadaceae bacterium]|nr:hypothetical protein [Xanthomonadaceae bacterium]